MAIARLLQHSGFDAETTALLGSAFDAAWDILQKSGSEFAGPANAERTRGLLAVKIIGLGQQGIQNSDQLVESALAHVSESYLTAADEMPRKIAG